LQEKYDFIIIGSGIGGLLTAGLLARDGYSIAVLEKLSFFGGKYTSIKHNGVEVPTAAHHMLPHGYNGHIYRICQELGISIKLIPCQPPIIWKIGRRDYIFPLKVNEYFKWRWRFPVLNKILKKRENAIFLFYLLLYKLGYRIGGDPTVKELLEMFTQNTVFHRAVNKTIQYALGVKYDSVPAAEILRTFREYNYSMEAVVDGGVKSIITGLVNYLRSKGCTIKNRCEVKKIIITDGRADRVILNDGTPLFARMGIVSNAGIKNTFNMIDDKQKVNRSFIHKMERAVPAWGVNHILIADKPVVNRGGVIIPVETEYIAGITEPTYESPSIGGNKKTLVLAYQVIDRNGNIDIQLEKGKEEFLHLCRGAEGEYIMSVFRDNYPGTEMAAEKGQVYEQRFGHDEMGIIGLWNIGLETFGRGIAGELIGHSVRILYNRIKEQIYYETRI
jgi:phytoene dehydrogenase-like protein